MNQIKKAMKVFKVFPYLFILLFIFSCKSSSNQTDITYPEKYNLIIVMADDLGFGHLGCFGQELIQTPNLDKLAESGMKFTQFYSASPVCAPSRNSLLTGQHTGHTTIRANYSTKKLLPYPYNRVPLKSTDYTMAKALKQSGYVTGVFGKWGLGGMLSSGIPNKQGFDEWFGYLNQKAAHDYYPRVLWKNRRPVWVKGNWRKNKRTFSHYLIMEKAMEFLEVNRDTNFFLFLPVCLPHGKHTIPNIHQEYVNKDWTRRQKVFASMISQLDFDIGRIIDTLKTYQIENKTLFLFLSDNGASNWENPFQGNLNLRGYKQELYEGGIRVPLIASLPGVIAKSDSCTNYGYMADLYPTILDLLKIENQMEFDGSSLMSLLSGSEARIDERVLYWEYHDSGMHQAARWRKWKAVRKENEAIELYNLSNDIYERFDQSSSYPQIIHFFDSVFCNSRTDSPFWPLSNKTSQP